MLTHLDLCSGIGGFSLGLRMAGGFETVGFCEIDLFCRSSLAKNFTGVWIHDDIRTLTADLIRQRCGDRSIDVVTAGIPCQPASCAGKRLGASDDRWLWDELLRVVREVRPRYLLAENPTGFITLEPQGLDWLSDSLEAAGYETFSTICPADAVGAPHQRERVWIMGYYSSARARRLPEPAKRRDKTALDGTGSILGDIESRRQRRSVSEKNHRQTDQEEHSFNDSNFPMGQGFEQYEWEEPRVLEFGVVRSTDGVSEKLARREARRARQANNKRIEAFGNSVVPQIVALFGRAILDLDALARADGDREEA